MDRPKDIGTAAETAVVRHLAANGFPHAERRALHGEHDLGDVTGCPGLVFEVKGGQAAKTASDGQVAKWLTETEVERVNARADYGVLVLQRAGIGPKRAGEWWAVLPGNRFVDLIAPGLYQQSAPWADHGDNLGPVRMWLADALTLLRLNGYGTPL